MQIGYSEFGCYTSILMWIMIFFLYKMPIFSDLSIINDWSLDFIKKETHDSYKPAVYFKHW